MISVREVTRPDIPAVLALIRSLALNENPPEIVDAMFTATALDLVRDGFGDRRRYECLVAERAGAPNGAIVGMALFYETYSSFSARPGLYLEDFFVVAEERRHGVGEMLIRALARIGVARRCVRLDLAVMESNPARSFYRRFGFHHRSEFQFFRLSEPEMTSLVDGTTD
jgi:ribosomal protein S18 acetylase RimI-like enzyme